jgi:hypothetical protein
VHDLANPAAETAPTLLVDHGFPDHSRPGEKQDGHDLANPAAETAATLLVDHGFPDRSRPGENREGIAGCSEFFTIIMAENQHDTQ